MQTAMYANIITNAQTLIRRQADVRHYHEYKHVLTHIQFSFFQPLQQNSKLPLSRLFELLNSDKRKCQNVSFTIFASIFAQVKTNILMKN